MAIQLLFMDGFDYYNDLTLLWDQSFGNNSIETVAGNARTGKGYCQLNTTSTGPQKIVPNLSAKFIMCTSFKPNGAGQSPKSTIMDMSVGADKVVRLTFNTDMAIIMFRGNDPFPTLLVQSANGVLQENEYNSIVCKVNFAAAGSIDVYVNGVNVIAFSGNVNGPYATPVTFQLHTNPFLVSFHDDVSVWNWNTGDSIADLLLNPGIYPAMPNVDSTPINWTPSTGLSHFAMVDEIPQDLTDYNSSSTPGNIDQYFHAVPVDQQVPAFPTNPVILGLQYQILAGLDSIGARTLATNVDGVAGTSVALASTSAHYIVDTYAPSPVATPSDLATVPAGPEVIA